MRIVPMVALVVLAIPMQEVGSTRRIKQAESIEIIYTVLTEKPECKRKQITLKKHDEVKKLLDVFEVESIVQFGTAKLARVSAIRFIQKDGTGIEVLFADPKELIEKRKGEEDITYELKNKKLYELVNEIVSKAEGRRVDVMTSHLGYPVGKLKIVETIKIIYTIGHKRKELTVDDNQQIKFILAQEVEKTEKTDARDIKAKGFVRYIGDAGSVDQIFISPKRLYEKGESGGLYYNLKNTKFYDLANEIASKAEGKKIDVLKDN